MIILSLREGTSILPKIKGICLVGNNKKTGFNGVLWCKKEIVRNMTKKSERLIF